MDESLMKELCDNLNMLGGSMPALKIPEMFELIEELYTEEEARIASKMPAIAKFLKSGGDAIPVAAIVPYNASLSRYLYLIRLR